MPLDHQASSAMSVVGESSFSKSHLDYDQLNKADRSAKATEIDHLDTPKTWAKVQVKAAKTIFVGGVQNQFFLVCLCLLFFVRRSSQIFSGLKSSSVEPVGVLDNGCAPLGDVLPHLLL